MTGTRRKAFGYQRNSMTLPVADLDAAPPFHENTLGFRVRSRGEVPHRSAVLGRDDVERGLVENGGDPTQDGRAFHVSPVEALRAEFGANGLDKELSALKTERRDGGDWNVSPSLHRTACAAGSESERSSPAARWPRRARGPEQQSRQAR